MSPCTRNPLVLVKVDLSSWNSLPIAKLTIGETIKLYSSFSINSVSCLSFIFYTSYIFLTISVTASLFPNLINKKTAIKESKI